MSSRRSRLHRAAVAVTAAALAWGLTGLSAPANAATVDYQRLAGSDRYATAAAIAGSFTSPASVILASGENYPDALAGAYLAGVYDVPLLLTASTSLPASTEQALTSLGVHKVYVLGGTGAVSATVTTLLTSLGYTVERIGGVNRYETAQKIATSPGVEAPVALLASGLNFPDALTAGPVAYSEHFPLLLTDPNNLPTATAKALSTLKVSHVIVLGGTAAVSTKVISQLTAMNISSERLAGLDRQRTALAVAGYELSTLGWTGEHMTLARGDDFPDGLAAGPMAGLHTAPILLTVTPDVLGTSTKTWLADHVALTGTGTIFGGTGAVSAAVEAEVEALYTSTSGTTGGTSAVTASDLTLSPQSTTGFLGTNVVVTATVTGANGAPVSGVPVDVSVTDVSTEGDSGHDGAVSSGGACGLSSAASPSSTGAALCEIDASDPKTDSAGHVTFAFHWTSPYGKRPLQGSWTHLVTAFTGPVGQTLANASVKDTATVTWVNAVSSINVTPVDTLTRVGTDRTFTATLMSTNMEGETAAVPLAGQAMGFLVTRNGGATPVVSGSALTDATGAATFTYGAASAAAAGDVDTVTAYWDRNGNAALDSAELRGTTTTMWSDAEPAATSVALSPAQVSLLAGAGSPVAVTATVLDQYGNVFPAGAPVAFSVNGGTAVPVTALAGVASYSVPVSQTMAKDVVTATYATLPAASATVYWVVEPASGSYTGKVIGFGDGYVDLAVPVTAPTQYLRFFYTPTDVKMIGTQPVRDERWFESVKLGVTMTVDYQVFADSSSRFVIASSMGGGGHGG